MHKACSYIISHLIFLITFEIEVLQMRKVRLKKIQQLAQSLVASQEDIKLI